MDGDGHSGLLVYPVFKNGQVGDHGIPVLLGPEGREGQFAQLLGGEDVPGADHPGPQQHGSGGRVRQVGDADAHHFLLEIGAGEAVYAVAVHFCRLRRKTQGGGAADCRYHPGNTGSVKHRKTS